MRAWIELDRSALAHNIGVMRRRLPAGCRLMPAVKANAYGHGAALVAGECSRLGVDAFCVACAQEGAELRESGIVGEILILGYTDPKEFELLERYRLTQTVVDSSYAEALNRCGRRLHVHVAVDTGMHRLGEDYRNADQICRMLGMEHLIVDGMFSHLCTADTDDPADRDFVRKQAAAFYDAADAVRKSGHACPKLHLLSSYGIFRYPEYAEDYVRPGIALFGVASLQKGASEWAGLLKPVLSFKAKVASVKRLEAGECAGYGRAFAADRERRLAVVAAGYADGLPRCLSNGVGAVLIHGKKAPVAGRICMDQTLVDVTEIPAAGPGDTAVLIGRSGEEEITACDLAEQAQTISNEILSRLGARLERVTVPAKGA